MPLNVRVPIARRATVRAAGAALIVMGASITYLHAARPDRAPQEPATRVDRWDAFRADVTITQHKISAAGAPIGTPPPTVSLHIARSRGRQGWKTAMTFTSLRPIIQSASGVKYLKNPFEISRIESDEDGVPRFYDREGQRVPDPDEAAAALFERGRGAPGHDAAPHPPRPAAVPAMPQAWMDAVIARPDDRGARRERIEKQFGPQVGMVGRLHRFVLNRGGEQQEVLVDPDSSVPVEINISQNGTLTRHTRVTYAQYAGGVLTRKSLETEQAMAGSTDRLVTSVELSNVSVEGGVQ